MTNFELLPVGRNVSIASEGSFRSEAALAIRHSRLWAAKSRLLFSSIVPRRKFTPAQSLRVSTTRINSRFYSSAAVAFSAIAVEGFLNQYAVVRLGARASDRAFVSKDTVEKTVLLIRLITGSHLGKNSELVRRIKRLATRRNALVHPKTYEVERGDEHLKFERLATVAEASYEDMEFFFREFERRDSGSRSWTWY